jgi:PAS domain S-box-containing protein
MQEPSLLQQGLDAARLVETAAEGVWVIDANSKTAYVNARMAAMLGYAISEMIGASLFDFMEEDWKPVSTGNVARRQQGIAEQHDFKFRRKDGSDLWVIITTNPLFDEDGDYAGSLGMVTDITERKRMEDALYESESRYRVLAETLPQMVWTARPDGTQAYLNMRGRDYLGSDIAVLPAITWETARQTEEPYEAEHQISDADGRSRWFLVRAVPHRDSRGVLVQWVGTCTDIHSQKEAAQTQGFLVALEDRMRQGTDADDVLWGVVTLLGDYLNVSRCAIGEINPAQDTITVHRDYCRGVSSMAGTYPRASWGIHVRDALRAGQTVVFDDTLTDPRTIAHYADSYGATHIRAGINVPIMQDGIQQATLAAQMADGPRSWTPEEIALVQTVADRAWLAVENVRLRRAERDQHQRTSAILESIQDGFVSIDHQWRYTYVNQAAEELLGVARIEMLGSAVWDIFPQAINSAFGQAARRAIAEGIPVVTEVFSARRNGWFEEHIYPSPDGLSVFFHDITLQKQAEANRQELEYKQRTLMRDVLANVTDGRLRLCDEASLLPARLTIYGESMILSAESLPELRHRAVEAARIVQLPDERVYDLLTAVGEAGMNAVVHAGGGIGNVYLDQDSIQVWVEDQGAGISLETLPRATLEKGYTTAGTLGHGLKMMIGTVDHLWLLTGPNGTTVVLEKKRHSPLPDWL